MGVAAFLNRADNYSSQTEMEQSANILRDAVALRFHATEGRAAVRKATEEDKAAKPKRTRKAKA